MFPSRELMARPAQPHGMIAPVDWLPAQARSSGLETKLVAARPDPANQLRAQHFDGVWKRNLLEAESRHPKWLWPETTLTHFVERQTRLKLFSRNAECHSAVPPTGCRQNGYSASTGDNERLHVKNV